MSGDMPSAKTSGNPSVVPVGPAEIHGEKALDNPERSVCTALRQALGVDLHLVDARSSLIVDP
jgi:hypothetical protein